MLQRARAHRLARALSGHARCYADASAEQRALVIVHRLHALTSGSALCYDLHQTPRTQTLHTAHL